MSHAAQVLLVDPDIFDDYCLGFGDCGLGYAVWEKNSRGEAYAPKFFSDELVWSYKNVTFVAMDCKADFKNLHAHLELWMSQMVVHSYDVYNATLHGALVPMFSSDQRPTLMVNLIPNLQNPQLCM